MTPSTGGPHDEARHRLSARKCTRLTYALRELARTLEAEGAPVDVPPSTSERESSELPCLRALLAEIVGGPA